MPIAIGELVEQLRKIASKVPTIESVYPLSNPTFGNGLNEELIAAFEDELGIGRLPEDLRAFFIRFAPVRAMDIFNGYDLYDLTLTQHVALDDSIPMTFETNAEAIRVIPVAGDGGGNQFMIALSGPAKGSVWKWSHELVVETDRKLIIDGIDWGVWKVGDTYSEFLARVAEDWRAFVEGDRDWQYISG